MATLTNFTIHNLPPHHCHPIIPPPSPLLSLLLFHNYHFLLVLSTSCCPTLMNNKVHRTPFTRQHPIQLYTTNSNHPRVYKLTSCSHKYINNRKNTATPSLHIALRYLHATLENNHSIQFIKYNDVINAAPITIITITTGQPRDPYAVILSARNNNQISSNQSP